MTENAICRPCYIKMERGVILFCEAFFYPSFSFWCLGVVSLWTGVLMRHLWPQTGVEVSAGVSKPRCSVPDMLQIWEGGGTQTDMIIFIPSTLGGINFGKVDNE